MNAFELKEMGKDTPLGTPSTLKAFKTWGGKDSLDSRSSDMQARRVF